MSQHYYNQHIPDNNYGLYPPNYYPNNSLNTEFHNGNQNNMYHGYNQPNLDFYQSYPNMQLQNTIQPPVMLPPGLGLHKVDHKVDHKVLQPL